MKQFKLFLIIAVFLLIGCISNPPSTAISTTSSSGGAGGGTIGATRQCREYAVVYKTCYYFDGISQCLKGCPKGQSCNSTYECFGEVQTTQTTSLQSPLNPITSPISRFFAWVKGLLGLSLNNPELSILGGSAEQPIKEQTTQTYGAVKQAAKEAFQQNKWLPYIIVGIVIMGFGVYAFGLWETPLAFILGLGAWGYIIIFILFILIYLFFKYF